MPEILHRVFIEATPEKIFNAITTENGLKSWWTVDVKAQPKEGTVSRFGFPGHTTVFHMHIDTLIPNKSVKWTCQGEDEEWKNTTVNFDIKPQGDNQSILSFNHNNWRSTNGYYVDCNTTWGHLMVLLKEYAEGKNPGPYFKL